MLKKAPWASLQAQVPSVTESQWRLLEQWAQLMREWNAKINLISRKDIDFLELRHLAHCLAISNYLKLMQGARVLDVGTGGGFPGLIMAIAYPQAHFTLVDSIAKKIMVVQTIATELGLQNVEARQCRAESVNKQFDFVTGRAVKNLQEFIGWIKGNLRRGQRNSLANGILYWKGGRLTEELATLGIDPRLKICLDGSMTDSYFANKLILHFDARDVPRARSVGQKC